MPNITLKAAALQVMQATVTATDRCRQMEFDSGRHEVSLEIADWPIGKRCREPFTSQLDALAVSHLSSDKHRLEFIVQLSKALLASASELLDFHERTMKSITSKLSKGLDSLPDEVLAVILNFATLDEQEGTQHALWLSHVSRRFRGVALGDHSLWSTIRLWGNTTKELIETCVSRSGKDTDLHIIFNYGDKINTTTTRTFEDSCSALASRWRSLTLAYQGSVKGNAYPIGSHLGEVMRERLLRLPRLYELTLSQCDWPILCCSDELHWTESSSLGFLSCYLWETPGLRVLRCVQYIPPTSFPFTSFTTLSLSLFLTLDDGDVQIRELLNFLSIQHNISTLELELDSFTLYSLLLEYDDGIRCLTTCPSITTFRLTLMNIDASSYVENTFRPIWKPLLMPNLEDFFLSIDILSLDIKGVVWEDFTILSNIGALLPPPDAHPELTSVAINVTALGNKEQELRLPARGKQLVTKIPLTMIPHVTTLRLTTCSPLSFICPHVSDIGGRRLSELHFDSCENLDADGLRETAQSLRATDAWDTLERVFISQCDLLDYKSALEEIGKERLRFNC